MPSGWGLGVWLGERRSISLTGQHVSAQWVGFGGVVGGEEKHQSHGTACECPVGGAWGGGRWREEHQSHGTECECPVGGV